MYICTYKLGSDHGRAHTTRHVKGRMAHIASKQSKRKANERTSPLVVRVHVGLKRAARLLLEGHPPPHQLVRKVLELAARQLGLQSSLAQSWDHE